MNSNRDISSRSRSSSNNSQASSRAKSQGYFHSAASSPTSVVPPKCVNDECPTTAAVATAVSLLVRGDEADCSPTSRPSPLQKRTLPRVPVSVEFVPKATASGSPKPQRKSIINDDSTTGTATSVQSDGSQRIVEIPEWTRLVQERNEARVAEAQAIDERDDAQRERAEIAAQLVKSQILFVQQASDLVLLQQDHNELATKLHQALQHGNLFKAQLLAQAAEVRQSQQVQQQKQVQLQGPDDVTSTDTSITTTNVATSSVSADLERARQKFYGNRSRAQITPTDYSEADDDDSDSDSGSNMLLGLLQRGMTPIASPQLPKDHVVFEELEILSAQLQHVTQERDQARASLDQVRLHLDQASRERQESQHVLDQVRLEHHTVIFETANVVQLYDDVTMERDHLFFLLQERAAACGVAATKSQLVQRALKTAQSQLKAVAKEHDKALYRNKELVNHLRVLEEKLDTCQLAAKQAQLELERVGPELDDKALYRNKELVNELRVLEEKLDTCQLAAKQAQLELERVGPELDDVTLERDHLQSLLQERDAACSMAATKSQLVQRALKTAQSQLTAVSQKHDKALYQNKEIANHLRVLEEKLDTCQLAAKQAQVEVERVGPEHAVTLLKIRKCKRELDQATTERDSSRFKFKQVTLELEQLRMQLDLSDGKAARASSQLSIELGQVRGERDKALDSIKALTKQVEQVSSERESSVNYLHEVSVALDKVVGELEILDSELEQTKLERDAANTQITALSVQNHELSVWYDSTVARLSEMAVDNVFSELEVLDTELEQTKLERDAANTEIIALTAQIHELSVWYDLTVAKLSETTSRLTQVERDRDIALA